MQIFRQGDARRRSVSVGVQAILEAQTSYNPAMGTSFLTFSAYKVRAAIAKYVAENRTIRVPVSVQRRKYLIQKCMSENPTYTHEQIGAVVGMTAKTVRKLLKLDAMAVSLNAPVEDGEVMDFIAETREETSSELLNHLRKQLKQLSALESAIIQERFLNEERKTYHQIAELHGVSHEYVRQLEHATLRKLRKLM